MLELSKINLTVLAAMICLATTQLSHAAENKTAHKATSVSKASQSDKLPSGLYLVRRQDRTKSKVQPIAEDERLLADDYHFLEPAEREPVRYVVLQTKPFIPLLLGADPKEDKEDGTGKPRLRLELTEDQRAPLEEFTKAHLGETVAIVVGGDIVTTHKVKTPITGGKLQITRCTEHGCETLFTKLLKKPNK